MAFASALESISSGTATAVAPKRPRMQQTATSRLAFEQITETARGSYRLAAIALQWPTRSALRPLSEAIDRQDRIESDRIADQPISSLIRFKKCSLPPLESSFTCFSASFLFSYSKMATRLRF